MLWCYQVLILMLRIVLVSNLPPRVSFMFHSRRTISLSYMLLNSLMFSSFSSRCTWIKGLDSLPLLWDQSSDSDCSQRWKQRWKGHIRSVRTTCSHPQVLCRLSQENDVWLGGRCYLQWRIYRCLHCSSWPYYIRRQTLSVDVNLDCDVVDATCAVTGYVEVDLTLDTTAAHAFNFIADLANTGTGSTNTPVQVVACFELDASAEAEAGSAEGHVSLGSTMLIVQEASVSNFNWAVSHLLK